MKRAKFFLYLIMVCAIAGGLAAFRIAKFTMTPVFTPTTVVYETVGTKVYYTTGNLCTTNGWFITTAPVGLSHVYYLVTTQPPITTRTLREVAGPLTITRAFFLCTTIITNVTTEM